MQGALFHQQYRGSDSFQRVIAPSVTRGLKSAWGKSMDDCTCVVLKGQQPSLLPSHWPQICNVITNTAKDTWRCNLAVCPASGGSGFVNVESLPHLVFENPLDFRIRNRNRNNEIKGWRVFQRILSPEAVLHHFRYKIILLLISFLHSAFHANTYFNDPYTIVLVTWVRGIASPPRQFLL